MAPMMANKSLGLSVIIPAYNCERQISRVIDRCMQVAYLHNITQLVVIDNRSTDNTLSEAKAALHKHKNLLRKNNISAQILLNDENYSLGGSHKVGFRYCIENHAENAIVLHGDDQADPNDFNDLFATGIPSDVDAILGSRFMRGSKLSGYSLFRQGGNAVFNFLLRLFGFGNLRDMGSGLNFYRLDRLPTEAWANAADNLTFNLYFLLSMSLAKAKLRFVPISWREEDQKSNVKLFSQSLELLKVILLARCIGTRMTSRNYGRKAQISDYTFKKMN